MLMLISKFHYSVKKAILSLLLGRRRALNEDAIERKIKERQTHKHSEETGEGVRGSDRHKT